MGNLAMNVDKINAMNKLEIADSEAVHENFVRIYSTLFRAEDAEGFYEAQKRFFNQILSSSDYFNRCTNFSVFNAFIDIAVSGLSLEPGVRALCYLQPRSFKVGEDYVNGQRKNIYEGRVTLVISGYGELVLRERCGQIKYADNPVLVYENDSFSFGENNGQKNVNYTCNLPHAGKKIIAGYMRIVRADGSVDYAVMYEEDWLRLQGYSEKNNRNEKPNDLYVSNEGRIDPGFLVAKIIKHAFKTYPKVKIGQATQLQTEQRPQEEDDVYGGLFKRRAPEQEDGPVPVPEEEKPFGPAEDVSKGVTVDDDEETF